METCSTLSSFCPVRLHGGPARGSQRGTRLGDAVREAAGRIVERLDVVAAACRGGRALSPLRRGTFPGLFEIVRFSRGGEGFASEKSLIPYFCLK